MSTDAKHGVWWGLIGLLGCRWLGALGQLGGGLAMVAGLSSPNLVLDSWFGTGIPLPALVGGAGVGFATTALQAGLLCAVAWLARPVRFSTIVIITVVAAASMLFLPLVQGGVGTSTTLAVSRLGSNELAAYSMAGSVVGMLNLLLGPVPLLAGLVTVMFRLHLDRLDTAGRGQ